MQAALNLRPLSLGEVLDRAFHLYFKNIAPFTAILAIVIVPSALLSYLQTKDMLNVLISVFAHTMQGHGAQPDLSKLNAIAPSGSYLTFQALQYLILFVGLPFANGAVVAGVSQAYLGLPVRFADAYRVALRRWLAILILMFLWFVVAIFVILVMFAFFFLIVFLGAALTAATRGTGGSGLFAVTLGIFLIAAIIVGLCAGVFLYLTFAMSFIAVVIEHVDPIQAFGGAISRMFASHQFWRGFVLALALAGINFGLSAVLVTSGMLFAFLLKAPALYIIAAELQSLFFAPFAIVAAAVFYYDIRIRREGYDLQMLADRFASALPPAAPSG